jgi:hypothetical protein
MIIKEPNPHLQSFSTANTSKLSGNANIKAVKNESCRGEMFFGESILRRYKAQVTRHKPQVSKCSFCTLNLVPWFLQFKFISDTFYGSYTIHSKFLADLADMNIDRSVANDHFSSPYLAEYLISYKYSSGF